MQRHRRRTPSRVGLGTVIVGVVLSLMCFGISPAEAAPETATHTVTRNPVRATHLDRPCGPTVNARVATRCAGGPQQVSEGGCGFLQRCLYFSRNEQLILLSGGSATIVALICGATALLGCATAAAVVGAAVQWLNSRGGICPLSRPKLRVQYFPMPAVEGCVS
jgi:hypothetical protein